MQALLTSVVSFFKGKKTYLIGILMVILGLLQDNQETILTGLGFITLRAGIVTK